MASTPAVLSIGRRCMDYGYEFRWPAGKLPYFITPSGVKVTLVVEDYVPYLLTGLASRTARAVTTLRKGHANPSTKVKMEKEIIPNEEISPGDPDWVSDAEPVPGVVGHPGESIPRENPPRSISRVTFWTWRMSQSCLCHVNPLKGNSSSSTPPRQSICGTIFRRTRFVRAARLAR